MKRGRLIDKQAELRGLGCESLMGNGELVVTRINLLKDVSSVRALVIFAVNPVSGRTSVREAPETKAPLGSLRVPCKEVVAICDQSPETRSMDASRCAETTRGIFIAISPQESVSGPAIRTN